VYRALLAAFEGLSQDPELDLTLATHFETSRSIAEDGMAILPGLKELRTGICIVCSRGENTDMLEAQNNRPFQLVGHCKGKASQKMGRRALVIATILHLNQSVPISQTQMTRGIQEMRTA
jgi:hypothetical protein